MRDPLLTSPPPHQHLLGLISVRRNAEMVSIVGNYFLIFMPVHKEALISTIMRPAKQKQMHPCLCRCQTQWVQWVSIEEELQACKTVLVDNIHDQQQLLMVYQPFVVVSAETSCLFCHKSSEKALESLFEIVNSYMELYSWLLRLQSELASGYLSHCCGNGPCPQCK